MAGRGSCASFFSCIKGLHWPLVDASGLCLYPNHLDLGRVTPSMSRMSRDRQHRWGGHRMRPASCPVLSSPAAITTHRVPELNLLAASTGRAFLTLSAPCSDGGPPNALNAMQHPHLQLVGTSRTSFPFLIFPSSSLLR